MTSSIILPGIIILGLLTFTLVFNMAKHWAKERTDKDKIEALEDRIMRARAKHTVLPSSLEAFHELRRLEEDLKVELEYQRLKKFNNKA